MTSAPDGEIDDPPPDTAPSPGTDAPIRHDGADREPVERSAARRGG